MTLYTKNNCPLCNVIKVKMAQTNLQYEVSMDEDRMEELHLDRLPVLELDDGTLLEFKQILNYIEEVKQNEN